MADGKERSEISSGLGINDRGFYVDGDRFTDEYTAASVFDFPEDEMNSPYSSSVCYGPDDAVEVIEFQQPGQSIASECIHKCQPVGNKILRLVGVRVLIIQLLDKV
uniref:Uncharacterized protein n=1 Tax=Parascaris equorum TaxID=6256 RepID=A0A914S810_PAREQ